jgi:hypothetical protein
VLQTRITTDPDIVQAVEDKLADLAEIRDLIVAEKRLNAQRPTGRIDRIAELFGEIVLRAERIGIDASELIRMVSAELDRRGGDVAIAAEVRNSLALADQTARADEKSAQDALAVAQRALAAAQLARIHAQARCQAFSIDVLS